MPRAKAPERVRSKAARRRPTPTKSVRLANRLSTDFVALWLALGLAAITLAVFASVRAHDFIDYDDPIYINHNVQVLNGLTWSGIRWAFTSGYAENWHPLTWLSHMLDIELFGLQPGLHHLTNLVLHVGNTLLLFAALY